jgi:hypothetical protein
MHFGYVKETFQKGTVVVYDREARKTEIDGRKFDDYRDVEILLKQSTKSTVPWLVPYSEEELSRLTGEPVEQQLPTGMKRVELEIVQDDSSSHEMIDVSHTKVSEVNRQKREAAQERTKTEDLEVVKGDESPEERLSRLKTADETDISARAERVRIMQEKKAEMPIVQDDSLGVVGSNSTAMNVGSKISGKRASEEAEARAAARKASAHAKRDEALAEQGLDVEEYEVLETAAQPEPKDADIHTLKAEADDPPVDYRDAEISRLRAELEELKNNSEVRFPVLKEEDVQTALGI